MTYLKEAYLNINKYGSPKTFEGPLEPLKLLCPFLKLDFKLFNTFCIFSDMSQLFVYFDLLEYMYVTFWKINKGIF